VEPKNIRSKDISLKIDTLIELVEDLPTDVEHIEDSIAIVDACVYHLVCWGNIKNYELFIKKLQSISIIGDKLMGTLAQKWLADGEAIGVAKGKAKGISIGKIQGKIEGKRQGKIEGEL
jgi:hypothetical protein